MNLRTTGLLALVALGLGAFVYFYEIEGETSREAARESEKRIFADVEADAIDSLALTTTDGVAARFERREGSWLVVSPIEGRGDAMALDAITSALAQLARVGRVKSAAGDLAQFGLGPDARIVRFEVAGSSHSLRIGSATPVGGNVYVAADEGNDVVFVESYRLNAMKHALTDLRDRRIVNLDEEALQKLSVTWPEDGVTSTVALERDGEGDWQIRAPISVRADQQTVRELISNLDYLQATGFLDERTPAVLAALRETALELSWTERAASDPADAAAAAERHLRIAGLVDGSRVVESGGGLYLLAPERLADFARGLDDYRDKQLAELAPDALAKIDLTFAGGASVELVRAASGWSAVDREVEPDAVSALAETLASLRAKAVVADEMGDAELASVGLAPPAVRIRLELEAKTTTPIELELGRLDPDRGLFARRASSPLVYVLAASLAEALPLDLATFEQRYGKRSEAMEPASDERGDQSFDPSTGSAGDPASGAVAETAD
jgi:hypothetical protein